MKKLLITVCAFALSMGISFGQQWGSMEGSGSMEGDGPHYDVPPDIDPEILEAISVLRDQVIALRDDLRESREAVIAELGDDATREERIAAITEWQADYADEIANVRALTEELRLLIRENRPMPPHIELPDDIIAKREQLRERRTALAQSRRQAILALGENPTDEAVRAAVEAWRAENADEIEAVRALSRELRQWFRQNRHQRKGAFDTPRMLERRTQFRQMMQETQENRLQLREQLRNPSLTEEERHQIISTFREQQRDLMRERQMLKRQERLDQGGQGGDRRPGG